MKIIERPSFGDRNSYPEGVTALPKRIPPGRALHIEYAYYAAIFYSYNGPTLGISIPYVATIWIMGIMAFCILRSRHGLRIIYRPIFRPILCIFSYLAIQYYFHGEGLSNLISFFVWAASIIIIQSCFLRSGFFHRLSFVMLFIGLTVLPFIDFRQGEGAMRAGLSTASVLSNPNSLAVWFGFCSIYLLIRALQTPRLWDRILSGVLTIMCLSIVALTVSRSVLTALLLAIVFALRNQLKRGFLPVLLAAALTGGGFAYGLFDNAIGHYVNRGTEESGRTGVIPYAFQRFVDSPYTGVGVSNVGTVIPGAESGTDPHNAFLFFALVSGVVPLFLFLAYCLSAFKGALHATRHHPYAPYLMPLFVYCIVNLLFNDTAYTFPWFVAVFSACLIGLSGMGRQPVRQWRFQ